MIDVGQFLQLQGVASAAWVAAVPRAADWRLARLPRVLTDKEVRAFLAAFDRATPHGRWDYAMALCLLELGLRAGDVAQLTLAALDWRAGTLTLAPGKGRRGNTCAHSLPSVGAMHSGGATRTSTSGSIFV